ncbi:MAG: tetratricopeptide repeat protein [Propionibacteriaceae bacterium]|jgi:putative thioredoxin|nr:tetratricopeptide repeat protein [Propionibacteriaceae bacterium]
MAQVSGAVDLSQLSKTPAPTGGGYVTEVTEATFDATVRKSIQYPVVLEFYSAKAPESTAMGQTLTGLANAAKGAWLLARMNVDDSPQIVQALQIRAVPMVVGVLSGQLVPLWQGSMPKEDAEKVIGELLKMAAGNGVLGRVEPQGEVSQDGDDAEQPEDPRYTTAYDLMGQGDYAGAKAAFETILAADPGDGLAKIGQAQAGMLVRVDKLDFAQAVATANQPDASIDDVMAAADAEVASGEAAAGFTRLITAISQTSGDQRETLRLRLLELFATQDPSDKVVLTARRNLATALF